MIFEKGVLPIRPAFKINVSLLTSEGNARLFVSGCKRFSNVSSNSGFYWLPKHVSQTFCGTCQQQLCIIQLHAIKFHHLRKLIPSLRRPRKSLQRLVDVDLPVRLYDVRSKNEVLKCSKKGSKTDCLSVQQPDYALLLSQTTVLMCLNGCWVFNITTYFFFCAFFMENRQKPSGGKSLPTFNLPGVYKRGGGGECLCVVMSRYLYVCE